MAPPLILTQKEVDVLYDLLEILAEALSSLDVPFIPIAGSLLGAVRSRSILFNDDDVDVAIFITDYAKVRAELPALLQRHGASFSTKGAPFCDKIRSRSCSHVWIDLFVLKEYRTPEDVLAVISLKDNGQRQSDEYVSAVTRHLPPLEEFPIFHYHTRKGIELWPKEYFTRSELFPIAPSSVQFGHLRLASPHSFTSHLFRAFGPRCLTHYPHPRSSSAHLYVREFAQRVAALPLPEGAGEEEEDGLTPLTPDQLLPVLHSRHKNHPSSSSEEEE
jgi:hypothetical protein